MTDTRPYVIVNNENHPVRKQYTGIAISTKSFDGNAISLSDSDLMWDDKFRKQSYACPWSLQQLKWRQIERRIGTLKSNVVTELVREAQASLLAPEPATVDTGYQQSPTAVNAEE